MTIDGAKATRGLVSNTTDGVRGERGFDSGVHTFKITADSEGGWGSFAQIGVCTGKAKMHLKCKHIKLFALPRISTVTNLLRMPESVNHHNNFVTALLNQCFCFLAYGILIGKDEHSFGWNIPTRGLIHKEARVGLSVRYSYMFFYIIFN